MSYANAKNKNGILEIEGAFGNKQSNGVQHKGMIDYEGQPKFLKLDDINPEKGVFEANYNVMYSSVSEAIVSTFVKNMVEDDKFDCVKYEFVKVSRNGKLTSGTIADNFLRENEIEEVLASQENANTQISIDEYADNIYEVNSETRLNQLINYAENLGVKDSKHFFIQQAGFDVLMGNTDRLSNPSNFVFAYNTESKETRLVNMDYGRCLQTIQWHDMAEANYQPEYLEEDLDDYVKNVFSRNDSIVSSSKINESIEFLKEHGFEQFQIDLQQTFLDLDELKNQFEGTGFEKFATVKIETMKAVLQSEKIQELITDIGLHAEDFIGIESENNEINI